MTIPKVQEDPDKRKFRILAEEVDRLRDKVHALERKQDEDQEAPNPREEVPYYVQAAFRVICEYQAVTSPIRKSGFFGGETESVEIREPSTFELDIVRAASEVLVEYFNRHNPLKRAELRAKLENLCEGKEAKCGKSGKKSRGSLL